MQAYRIVTGNGIIPIWESVLRSATKTTVNIKKED
jgi:hypothetical protein